MQSAVDELYRVFKPYRLGSDFTGCDDCVSPADSQRLAGIPLRELTVSDLNRYAFKAMTTWGTDRHFRYFLPRLLELAIEDYQAFDFPEVLLGKLRYANWTSWPFVEQDAVCRFLDSFWLRQLNSPGNFPTDERIRTALGGLAEACDSIKSYLAIWSRQTAILPILHLAQLINDTADEIMTSGTIRLRGNHSAQCAELLNWLSSDDALSVFDVFRDMLTETFPIVPNQLDGVRAAMSTQ